MTALAERDPAEALFQAQELDFLGELSTYVLSAVALVLAIDTVASHVRGSLTLRRLAIEACVFLALRV